MTKQNFIAFMGVLMLSATFVVSASAQKKIELKYNLTPGVMYSYSMELDQDIFFETGGGAAMTVSNLSTFFMLMEIKDVDGDKINIEGKINRAKSSAAVFGMTVEYDSDDPSSGQNPMTAQMAEEVNKLINKPYFITMDHKGRLEKVDISTLSNNDDIANMFNSGAQFVTYPEEKVAPGETWNQKINPIEDSDMMVDAVYTLLKVTGKTATIGIKGNVSSNVISGSNMPLAGTLTGEIIVDTKTGWLIESKIDQELKLEVEQNGMKFPAEVSGTIITKSSEKN